MLEIGKWQQRACSVRVPGIEDVAVDGVDFGKVAQQVQQIRPAPLELAGEHVGVHADALHGGGVGSPWAPSARQGVGVAACNVKPARVGLAGFIK